MFTEKAQSIIDSAKDYAFAHSQKKLTIKALLAAVGTDPESSVRLAECLTNGDATDFRARCPEFGQPAPSPGKLDLAEPFREIIVSAAELSSTEGIEDRSHPGMVNLYHLVCAIALSRDACKLLGGLTPLSREEVMRILTAWQEDTGLSISIGDLVNKLRSLRTDILTKVFGQDHAIHAFIEALYNAEITAAADKERKTPMAVFVFAGPPGVGKTYMAELCASFLNRPFKRFDMTGYTDHQAHNQLVGFAQSYRGAHPGLLTGFVEKNPEAFLLFDEIEKAHLNTIQLFYQLLDAGRLEDKFSEKDISFRNTVIIFTTNAGSSLYDNPNKSGISAVNSGYHKKTILSALLNEKNPTTGLPSFPPAICSRLSQGYPIMFNHLGINELERVSASEITRTESLLEKRYFKNFSHDPLLPISLVFREGGRVDARQLRAEAEKFIKTELFKFCSLYAKDKLDDALKGIDKIRFELEDALDTMSPEFRSLYKSPNKPKVLLIANSRFTELICEKIDEMEWFTAASADESLDKLAVEDIDMVLLDIWIKRDIIGPGNLEQPHSASENIMNTVNQGQDFVPLSARALDEGRNILRRIHERFSDIPIYLLSFSSEQEPGDSGKQGNDYEPMATIHMDAKHDIQDKSPIGERPYRAIDDELFLACVRAGGARGLVLTNFTDVTGTNWKKYCEHFKQNLAEINRNLYREKKARSLAQERKVLLFDTSSQLGKKDRQLIIRIRDFRLTRTIDASDAGEMVEDIQRPTTRFKDVIGANTAKESLQFVVDWLKNPKRYAGTGVRPPKGILLTGPPGTGKTMLARAVAGESNCAFIEKSAAGFVTVWQGSGPQNVKDMFSRARRYAPAIVFIDELDAIGKKRTGGSGGTHSQEDALNALLTEMDGFMAPKIAPVIVLAATNLENLLDDALKRRFDRTIEVEMPDKAARLQYLEESVLKRKNNKVSRAMLERIAGQSAGLNIANLERIVHEAAVMAAQKDLYITEEIFLEAFEKTMIGAAKEAPDSETLERIARHESGHTLISWLSGKPPVQVTIVGRGGAGGYMEPTMEETKKLYTKSEIEQTIRELMGGRAAEIIYYGRDEGLSSGVSSDLERATVYADRMVRQYGMADDFGQVALSGQLHDGPLAIKSTESAEKIVKQQLENAIATLEKNRTYLDILVKSLLEKNRLEKKDLGKILPAINSKKGGKI